MAYTQTRLVNGKKVRVGTFMLVRQFKGIGRIRVASGTNDPRTFKQYDAAIQDLYDTGNISALLALKHKKCGVRDLYLWWRDKSRPSPWESDSSDLLSSVEEWLTDSALADTTKVGYRKCFDLLNKYVVASKPTIADLPGMLSQFRAKCASSKPPKAKTFNQTRAASLSFVRRRTGDRSHSIYIAIKNIDVITENIWSKRKVNNPLLPAEIDTAFSNNEDEEIKQTVWFLCLTGMTPKEYLQDGWEIDEKINAVRIFGRKRSGRYARLVPRVYQKLHPKTEYTYRNLLERFKAIFPGRSLYDLRRSFAVWNNRAGVDHIHTKAYMGHGASMTERYMAQSVSSWLLEDASKLANFIARDRTTAGSLPEERLVLPSTPEELARNLQDEKLNYFTELLNDQLKVWHENGKMRRLYKIDRLIPANPDSPVIKAKTAQRQTRRARPKA